MTRALLLALASAASVAAAAAPVPDDEGERAAVAAHFGPWVDKDGGSAFRFVGGVLRINMPARKVAGDYDQYGSEGPRFTREVAGDFTVVVRVSCPPQPAGRLSEKVFLAAGLAAEDAAGNLCVIRRYEKESDGYRTLVENPCSSPGRSATLGSRGGANKAGPTYLRIVRTRAHVEPALSWDGKHWDEFGRWRMDWKEVVRVGPTVESTLNVPVEVTFDRYSLTQPKK
jgi:regulation of enolase protein 1 (concanavalin A-like superfamily)